MENNKNLLNQALGLLDQILAKKQAEDVDSKFGDSWDVHHLKVLQTVLLELNKNL